MTDLPDASESLVILDTHAWIWLLEGDERLRGSTFVAAAENASDAGRLFVCSISLAEVAHLTAAGRLRLVVPVDVWLADALGTPGLQIIEIDAAIAAESARLPGAFPGDTADRLIVAATRLTGGRLATADPQLRRYGESGHVRILPIDGRTDLSRGPG